VTEAAAAARVLVVSRDDEMCAQAVQALGGAGYDVECATDATSAFARAEAQPPRLALVDLGLPRREGWTVLTRLRALPAPPHVIALVARADYRAFAQAIREGADAYVFRPFVAADLLSLCEAVLARATHPPVREVRQHVRRLVSAEVSVLSADGVALAAGEMANLGAGGAQVRLPVRLDPSTRVRLMLPVPFGEALLVDAVVQWNGRTASGFAHGLQFVDLTLARRRELADLLDAPGD
jgi:DNA-binding response OmpR family regulator